MTSTLQLGICASLGVLISIPSSLGRIFSRSSAVGLAAQPELAPASNSSPPSARTPIPGLTIRGLLVRPSEGCPCPVSRIIGNLPRPLSYIRVCAAGVDDYNRHSFTVVRSQGSEVRKTYF